MATLSEIKEALEKKKESELNETTPFTKEYTLSQAVNLNHLGQVQPQQSIAMTQAQNVAKAQNTYQQRWQISRTLVLSLMATIKNERLAQGLTQSQVAAKALTSKASISRAETNGWISINLLVRIVDALGKQLTLK